MPLELTSALLLLAVALLCGSWLLHDRAGTAPVRAAAPESDEWRDAALRHFREHRELQSTIAQVLASTDDLSGPARSRLLVALGAPRVDTFA